jgi:hypothetical protein
MRTVGVIPVTMSRKNNIMVTMVYGLEGLGYRMYVGSRSFRSWERAMAYAMLPAARGYATARRRVEKVDSGRWIVRATR